MIRSLLTTPTSPARRLLLHLLRTSISSAAAAAAAAPTPTPHPPVAIFWDLDNKPPRNIPPYDAAVRLKLAASRLGPLRFAVAYANPHSLRYVPPAVLDQRRRRAALDRLEGAGAIAPPDEPYPCRVCGRRFSHRTRLINHFKQVHEREHEKRLRRLESAKGARRVKLAAQMSVKMEKYRRAAGEVVVPRLGYGLADDLRRAGVWVRSVPDFPQAADRALRDHMVDAMDRGVIGCLMLVSDDLGFQGVLREARMRCLRTVVVGDDREGGLKRCADTGFSWREVASGKARDGARTVVGRWKDKELLSRLEWTYRPEEDEGREYRSGDEVFGAESGEEDDGCGDGLAGSLGNMGSGHWWELESDSIYRGPE